MTTTKSTNLESVLVKAPHRRETYTETELEDFAKCADPVTGPLYFMDHFFYIQHPTRGKMLYHPFGYQKRLIETYHNYRYSISMMPRQTGKCLAADITITIKNNNTGNQYNLPIGLFYEFSKAKRDGTSMPSITQYNINSWSTGDSLQKPSKPASFAQLPASMHQLSDHLARKFTNVVPLQDEWSIQTDSGWQSLEDVKQTVEYELWNLQLENGLKLACADDHIVFDQHMNEIFVKNLIPGQLLHTRSGLRAVQSVTNLTTRANMYDVGVNSTDHRFYSNNILSHNSTSAAGYILWYAMFVPDSTILIAAHKYTGAQEIMQRIRFAYELCPNHIRAGSTSYNKGSVDFDNGSRIVSATTTETTGRGMSISLLYSDEFAYVRPTIAKEFWTSISPTLATGGKAIITSTPNSDEDQFAILWKGAIKCEDEFGNTKADGLGTNGFRAFQSTWQEHPDRDQAWGDSMRAQLGDDRFRREICCEFIQNDETLIAPAKLMDLQGVEPTKHTGQVRWYKTLKSDSMYIVALDPSLGTGGDPAAIQVFEAGTTEQVAEWRHNKTDIPTQIRIMADIIKELNSVVQDEKSIYYSVENNTIGEAALLSIAEYGEQNIPGYFLSDNSVTGSAGRRIRKGFNTTHKAKLTACNKFKILVESKRMKINSKSLVSELKNFVAHGISYAAKSGETDDLVMSTLLVVRMLMMLQNYHPELDSYIKDHGDSMIEPLPFIAIFN